MNKKNRALALKELTKKANDQFFAELFADDGEGDTNDADEYADLKDFVRKILESTEIHLPGEED